MRLIGAVLLEANDEWQLQHRYMQIEGMAELDAPTDMPQPLIPGTECSASIRMRRARQSG